MLKRYAFFARRRRNRVLKIIFVYFFLQSEHYMKCSLFECCFFGHQREKLVNTYTPQKKQQQAGQLLHDPSSLYFFKHLSNASSFLEFFLLFPLLEEAGNNMLGIFPFHGVTCFHYCCQFQHQNKKFTKRCLEETG